MRFLSVAAFSLLLSVPAFAADLGQYRPGTPYASTVAPGADVCANQCSGDAQCRGWNYVKANPRAPGVCEFMSSVAAPIASAISISGEGVNATPFSSRLTSGGTNTVRVGTSAALTPNTVRVGQAVPQAQSRRVIRQAVPQRTAPQTASIPMENMSLTAQQNRYRNAAAPRAQMPVQQPRMQQPQMRQPHMQRPQFRPALDASPQARRPVQQAPALQAPVQRPLQQRPQQAPVQQSRPQVPQAYAPQQQAAPRPPQAQTMPRRSVAEAPIAVTRRPAPVAALAPAEAKQSLFGRLNDDAAPVQSRPTTPVTQENLPPLAGGR